MDPSPRPEPSTLRDTGPIRPLSRGASRIVVTVALVSTLALAIYAAQLIRSMSTDPEVQATVEQIEAMKSGRTVGDRPQVEQEGAPSTDAEPPGDSLSTGTDDG